MADAEATICNLALAKIGATASFIDTLLDEGEAGEVCALVYPQARDDLLRSFAWPFAGKTARLAQLGGADYSASHTYAAGDYANVTPDPAVVVNLPERGTQFVYISLQDNNTGHQPESSPTYWRQITRAAWAFCFALPSDYLKMRSIYRWTRNPDSDQKVAYDIESESPPAPGKILLSDAGLPWEVIGGSQEPGTFTPLEIKYTAQITDPSLFPSDFTSALVWQLASDLALAIQKDAQKSQWALAQLKVSRGEATANARQEVQRDLQPIPSHIRARR